MSWKNVSLESICNLLSGNAWSASKFSDSGEIPIIRIQNLGNNENEKFIWWNEEYDPKFIITKGDLLLSLSGSIKVDVWNGVDALLNQRIVKLSPHSDIDSRWFYWQIQNIILDIERMGKWALVNNVSISDLKNVQIPLPPLPIQKRIAEILDSADALRKKDQELLKKYDELAQAIFIDMFGDPVKNEKGWEVKKLGEVSSKITDGEHLNPQIVKYGKPLIMAKDIRTDGVDFSDYKCVSNVDFIKFTKKCNPQFGDLILVSRGATIGRCCIVQTDTEFCLMGSTILIKASIHLSTTYINELFKIDNFKRRLVNVSAASAQQAIYISNVKELNIPLPPIKKQLEYSKAVQQIQSNRNISNVAASKSYNLFDSLLQKAFSGELVS